MGSISIFKKISKTQLMKIVLLAVVGLMVSFLVYIWIFTKNSEDKDIIDLAPTVALTLTLIAVSFYVYETHSMASIMSEQLRLDNVYKVTYSMRILKREEWERGRTMFAIHNSSSLVIRAKVCCNIKLYGKPVKCKDDFDGERVWYAFPQQMSQGWFDIADILESNSTNIDEMISAASDLNRDQQLSMELDMHFQDELGKMRHFPIRRHYFAFKDWQWIPEITKKEKWSGDFPIA